MADRLSKARRSENMRQIRSKNTKPELLIRRLLSRMGYRFRLHRADLPGKPDLVFPARKKIIDVRGCFWHRHPGCLDSHIPKSRLDYWRPKLRRNVQRDGKNQKALRALGWKSFVVWECEATDRNLITLRRALARFLGKSKS